MGHRIVITIELTVAIAAFQHNTLAQPFNRAHVLAAMKKASVFYREQVAAHGGYVYHYSMDLSQRWGEGQATQNQIWVQPPGTPTVGLAYLKAYEATNDTFYLDAAQAAAEALVYGQVQSGGWTNCIDFDPRGERVSQYRNGKGRGRNTSSLDDGQTASALMLLIRTDKALDFKHAKIHEATLFGLNALLNSQYPNGAFPQVWDADAMPDPPVVKASFPDYDWVSEGRVKDYWNMYTLNDNVPGSVTETLLAAYETYNDDRYLNAVRKLGDFLILAQMPEPQPGWAQQYSYDMKPIWARKFEPPGVSGDETQEVIETLLKIANGTGDKKYLEPIPAALAYLKRSLLSDGQVARYYELRTNKPLYMERRGETYSLTHSDKNLPDHYGWKTPGRVSELSQAYQQAADAASSKLPPGTTEQAKDHSAEVKAILSQLDDTGRWVSNFTGERVVGQMKLPKGTPYLSSEVFSRNLELLSDYLVEDRGR